MELPSGGFTEKWRALHGFTNKTSFAYRPEKHETPKPFTTASSSNDLLKPVQDSLMWWYRGEWFMVQFNVQKQNSGWTSYCVTSCCPPIHILPLQETQGAATVCMMTSGMCELGGGENKAVCCLLPSRTVLAPGPAHDTSPLRRITERLDLIQ